MKHFACEPSHTDDERLLHILQDLLLEEITIMLRISLLISLVYICQASQLGPFRGIASFGVGDRLQGENMSDPLLHAESYTSGFLRNDTSFSLGNKWTRAQVWPIGTCFKEEGSGSSNLAHVYLNSSHIVGHTNCYDAPDCTGQYSSEIFVLSIVQTNQEFKNVVSYVADIEAALDVRSEDSDGLIFS